MAEPFSPVTAVPKTAFFDRTYDEAMALLVDARDYLERRERQDRNALAAPGRLRMSCETLRLTARITQMMAWLLAQKAVHAGEISTLELVERYEALADIAVCMDEVEVEAAGLPPRLALLLDRSRKLYHRVARLDEMVRRRVH
jgi:regulator of CtrA degradation